ncbi:MAG TPA: hypothetical protein VGI10_29890 [Polyangiaceae bacterium]|jgi:hypothetical protein
MNNPLRFTDPSGFDGDDDDDTEYSNDENDPGQAGSDVTISFGNKGGGKSGSDSSHEDSGSHESPGASMTMPQSTDAPENPQGPPSVSAGDNGSESTTRPKDPIPSIDRSGNPYRNPDLRLAQEVPETDPKKEGEKADFEDEVRNELGLPPEDALEPFKPGDFPTPPGVPFVSPESEDPNVPCREPGTGEPPVRYTAVHEGPLPPDIANTFRGASYNALVLARPEILFRTYGGRTPQIGSFWSRLPNFGLQARLDLALNPVWGNTATNIVAIQVPAGTLIFEGFAAPQGSLFGGGNQVFVPEIQTSWVVSW